MSVDSIFSENDYHKGCRNVSHCQQQSFSGLQQLYVHPAGDIVQFYIQLPHHQVAG